MFALRLLLLLLIGVVGGAGGLLFGGPVASGAWRLILPAPVRPRAHPLSSPTGGFHGGHVDLSTGLYIRDDDDLVLPGTPPFVLRRTYRTQDPVSRQFGVGATHNGEWYVRGDAEQFQWIELILPEARRVRFDRTTPGTSISTAVFAHGDSPEHTGATAAWLGLYWAIRWPEGWLAIFRSCGYRPGDACSILRLRDADNHWVTFGRDAAGVLRTITAGAGTIDFQYDSDGRITRADASTGQAVTYEYDDGGRLAVVRSTTGAVRSYGYSDRDEMISIDEPDHAIVNTFEHGRCVRQVSRLSDGHGRLRRRVIDMAYGASTQGTTTDVRHEDGWRIIWEFDPERFQIGATYYHPSGRTATAAVERDPRSHAARRVTISCDGGDGPVTAAAAVQDPRVAEQTDGLLKETCAGW